MAHLTLKDINKIYPNGFHAVHDFNLEIERGEFIVFVGPSGCGKSTTLRMIAGLENISKGDFLINGKRANEMGPRERGVAMVFQSYALYPQMTVYDNLAFGLTLQGVDEDVIDEKVKRTAKILGLTDYLDRMPRALSGGQRQRVAVGRAIIRKVEIFLMDEPLSNLDAKLRLEMRSELQRLHLSTGSTFVYVTHDQMEAMTLATRICLISNGVLQQYDAPLTVYNKPNNTFVADFVGNPAINFMNARGTQQADGSFELTILDEYKASFTPVEPVKVDEWYAEAEKEIAAFEAKERPAEKTNKDVPFNYPVAMVTDVEKKQDLDKDDWVVGVRPEFVSICDDGPIEGEVFSAMPTGMETTVRIRVGNYLLTSVIFGGITYKLGEKVRIRFSGEGSTLFSRVNGRLIATGKLDVK